MSAPVTDSSYNLLFKFLIIGNAGTGKSCILHQFIEQKFKSDTAHTIGVEFGSRIIQVNGKAIKLQIWDTAGQERFRAVTRSYYRGAAGALLVYDITCRNSYNALLQWLTDARSLASPHIVVLLVGNKKDLENEREVLHTEATTLAKENDMTFVETSALTGENVEEAFLKVARTILAKLETGEIDPERVGQGIQFGDTAVTNSQRLNRTRSQTALSRSSKFFTDSRSTYFTAKLVPFCYITNVESKGN